MSSSQVDISNADRDIISQILDSPEPHLVQEVRWLFWKYEELSKEFFPRLIVEFSHEEPLDDRLIEPMLDRLRYGKKYKAELKKYAPAIRQIMEARLARDPAGQYLNPVLAGHRFDSDEQPFLTAFPTGSDPKALQDWLSAVCELLSDRMLICTDEVLQRLRPVLMNEKDKSVNEFYVDVFRFLISRGLESEARSLLADAGIQVDLTLEANVFERRWSPDSLCRSLKSKRPLSSHFGLGETSTKFA